MDIGTKSTYDLRKIMKEHDIYRKSAAVDMGTGQCNWYIDLYTNYLSLIVPV